MTSQKTYVALFNYGGGMRGIVPAQIMSYIEDKTGLRMAEMVDIFAGPSTGAILNAALTRASKDDPTMPMYRARHLVKFYEREGLNIFPHDSFRDFRGILHDFNNRTLKVSQLNWLFRHGHYDPANLGKALKALYGDSMLNDSVTSLIIPTYNIDGDQLEVAGEKDETSESPARTINNFVDHGGHAVWLKNMKIDHPPGAPTRTPKVSLYDAVMASCAAPTYYPCHHFKASFPEDMPDGSQRWYERSFSSIDGVIFDNPCISYLGAIRRHIPEDANLIMIILGTGYTNRSVKKEDWNSFGSLGVVDPVNDLPLINIFFHASESALMQSFAEEMGNNLFVFNKSMITGLGDPNAPSTQIDDASPENLKKLIHFADSIVEENQQKLDTLCNLLVSSRDQKKNPSQKKSLLDRLIGKD
ncbi:MAG TPA: phospholipase [Micavibrio sp.]|nr:patatin-like phospholipase family protein [Pseudomonadota bacterium]HIF24937.1 phospholipase [Micavibrio sp.]HIL29555.1 phospholipase [Micavibrio sp.]